jgi:hypothetical protein
MSGISRLGALRVVDPKAWVAEVRAALEQSGGFLDEAAKTLEVSRRQLQRWLKDERTPASVRNMAAKKGPHRPKPAAKGRRK